MGGSIRLVVTEWNLPLLDNRQVLAPDIIGFLSHRPRGGSYPPRPRSQASDLRARNRSGVCPIQCAKCPAGRRSVATVIRLDKKIIAEKADGQGRHESRPKAAVPSGHRYGETEQYERSYRPKNRLKNESCGEGGQDGTQRYSVSFQFKIE